LATISLALLAAVAIGVAEQAARILGKKDPQLVVIDEIAGFALANFRTETTAGLIIAFVLFRFFDIAKIISSSKARNRSGSAGIVLDDMIAGLYTVLILRLFSAVGLV
jgi:phosphatidylglycerophosphatase A